MKNVPTAKVDLAQSVQVLQGIVRTLMVQTEQTELIVEASHIRYVNNKYELTVEHADWLRRFSPEIVVKVTRC